MPRSGGGGHSSQSKQPVQRPEGGRELGCVLGGRPGRLQTDEGGLSRRDKVREVGCRQGRCSRILSAALGRIWGFHSYGGGKPVSWFEQGEGVVGPHTTKDPRGAVQDVEGRESEPGALAAGPSAAQPPRTQSSCSLPAGRATVQRAVLGGAAPA